MPRSSTVRGRKPVAPVRFAVVGAGHIAQRAVLPAFRNTARDAALSAIVSGTARKRAELGRRYGVDRTFSYEQFRWACHADVFDAAYIALPNDMHREFAEIAANAGVHVLCEKPMAATPRDCEAMIGAARAAGVRLMIAYRLHFEASNMRAVEIVRSGRIGRPRFFHSAFSMQVRPGNIRVSAAHAGGPLADLGVYCINAARYLFGANPLRVSASASIGAGQRFAEVHEAVSATLEFPDDRLASFTCSFGAADTSWLQVVGEKGDVRLDKAYEYEGERILRVTAGGRTRVSTFAPRDQFGPELVYFARCVREERDPEPGGAEGLADVLIMQAIHKAVRSGKRIAIGRLPDDAHPGAAQVVVRRPVRPRALTLAASAHAE